MVAIPIIKDINDIPFAKFLILVNKAPKLNPPTACLSSGWILCISFNLALTLSSTFTISISSNPAINKNPTLSPVLYSLLKVEKGTCMSPSSSKLPPPASAYLCIPITLK
jgi:hypothetical protein